MSLILKIAGLGFLITVVEEVLKTQGRKDIANCIVVVGMILVASITIVELRGLLDTVISTFKLY